MNAPEARYPNTHCRPLPEYAKPGHVDEDQMSAMLDLIARMLEYEPQHRISLKESLKHPFFDRLAGPNAILTICPDTYSAYKSRENIICALHKLHTYIRIPI